MLCSYLDVARPRPCLQDNDNPNGELTHAAMTDEHVETTGLSTSDSEALAASVQWRERFVSCSTASGCGEETSQGGLAGFNLGSQSGRMMCGQA